MVRSLRWRLQIWHAAVLAAVLTSFGGIVYALQWRTRLQQVDANLEKTATVLASRLRGLMPRFSRQNFVLVPRKERPGWEAQFDPPTNLPNDFPPYDLPASESLAGRPELMLPASEDLESLDSPAVAEVPGTELAVADGALATRERRGERGPEGRGERGSGDRGDRGDRGERGPRWPAWWRPPPGPPPAPAGLELPEGLTEIFDGPGATEYFTIWDKNGELKEKSKSAPEIAWPEIPLGEDPLLPVRVARTIADRRESITVIPRFGWTVLVGQSLKAELAAHHGTGMRLILAGLGVLAVGLLGGWWSAARATQPIQAMTRTASAISARNLSQRIDVARTDNELGQLASVLNGAFDRLEAAFQKQTRFTADASHELRTPISVILANADFALSRARSEDEYRESLESVRRASQRMRSLIESLLTLARFDSGNTSLTTTRVDLPQLAQETVSLLEPLAKQRDIVLSTDAAPVAVTGDREQLSRVLVNLLTNAIRYNREGGTVRVEVVRRLGDAVISVTDDGIGIPAEHLPHIFDRFYRVDPARSRNDGGSGLGLSICRTIVEAHGGGITARSEPGSGTTIEVRLPHATALQPEAAPIRA